MITIVCSGMYITYIYIVYFRRRVEFDLVESPLLELSDDDLLELVRQLQQDNPDICESMAVGFVRSRGSEFQEHE